MEILELDYLQSCNKDKLIDIIINLQRDYQNANNKLSMYMKDYYDAQKRNIKLQDMISKDCRELANLQVKLEELNNSGCH